MTRRAAAKQTPRSGMVAPAIVAVGVVAAVPAAWFGGATFMVLWLAAVAASWSAPPVALTGKKDARGYATPADGRELAMMQRYRFWSALKWGLVFPTRWARPGVPAFVVSKALRRRPTEESSVLAIWIFGAWLAAIAWFVPHIFPQVSWVEAPFAMILATEVAAARRATVVADDRSPGVRLNTLRPTLTSSWVPGVVAGVSAIAGAVAAGWLGGPVWWALGAFGGAGLGLAPWWVDQSLQGWRDLGAARVEWAPRWQMLKHDPTPRLTARKRVGPATVDTFTAPGGTGAAGYWALAPKITPTFGGGVELAVLSCPATSPNLPPMPGTKDALEFRVVTWSTGGLPDLTDPGLDPEVAALFIECALVWAADSLGYGRPILGEVFALAEEGTDKQAFAFNVHLPDGPPMSYIRSSLRKPIATSLNTEVLVDHRAGLIYAGALTDGSTSFSAESQVTQKAMTDMATEDTWNDRWAAVLKQDVNPPTIEHATYADDALANGALVHRQAFKVRQGVDPYDFYGLEPKLKTVLAAAPFVAIGGWSTQGRVGERHPLAFTVYWSAETIPMSPTQLRPVGGQAPLWVLNGQASAAFRAARLAQPEVYDVRCLTGTASRGHIWQMRLRLYGGVTLDDTRRKSETIRQAWGVEWFRVDTAPDGCVVVAGVSPTGATFANARDEDYCVQLDWNQSFIDAGVVGVGGLAPKLTAVDRLPFNERVHVLDFDLPSGLSPTEVKAARKKLENSSRNAFVEVKPSPDGKAGNFRLLACEVNPMPEMAPFDFGLEPTDHRIPFATGLTGEPVTYDNAKDAHVLVSGAAGGGKSILVQNLVYGALIRGWDLWIADPSKGGVDFNFAGPYAKGMATTVWQAKGMVAAIYAEVTRRKGINSAHNCGNYRDLPDDVRYPHVLVVLDEFTSMMMPEPVPKAMDDSQETAAAIESVKAVNAARAYIGTYVGKIVREARSTGFTVVLATQALKADTLSKIPGANDLKDNMSRIIVGRASFGQLMAALKMPTEVPEQPELIPAGRGMYEGNGRSSELIQTWFEGSQAVFAEHLAARIEPLADTEKLNMSGFAEPELEFDGAVLPGQVIAPPVEPATEVDLGEFSFSLDDLELEGDAEDPFGPAPASASDDDPFADQPGVNFIFGPDDDPFASPPPPVPVSVPDDDPFA
ncbi:MAG: FtsK/SpoIIIE domain-containing protein [Nocardioides sp.]